MLGQTNMTVLVFLLLALGSCVGLDVDVGVQITSFSGQTISFDTGLGVTGKEQETTVEIYVFDLCRVEAGTGSRIPLGEFYPGNTVSGFDVDQSGVVNAPGAGNSVSYKFVEGIAQNLDIFTDHGDGTATLTFCVQVGIYQGEYLLNWEEIKILYNVQDLHADMNEIGEPLSMLGSAEDFMDSLGLLSALDDSLNSYYCNPNTQEPVDAGATASQGSIISICFSVIEGQFEVDDVIDLVVKDLGMSEQSQDIIIDDVSAGGYSEKWCVATSPTVQTCVVSFLLKASFFDYDEMNLGGEGALVMELGDGADGARRERFLFHIGANYSNSWQSRALKSQAVTGFAVTPQTFKVEKTNDPEKTTSSSSVVAGGAWFAKMAWMMASAGVIILQAIVCG